jgi:hypothetical protein
MRTKFVLRREYVIAVDRTGTHILGAIYFILFYFLVC